MKVIGTAGHIDHGKSTLVERLTGIDPDRLGEEKRRGMTIDLGFAWLTLPSGREVSIVDVPGHERFIKNMLAGAAGIDIALLVVAADEGVMPQTREHVDILDLLGVSLGVVALTKADLADPEWLDLVRAEVEESLAGTSLAGSPVLPVSARTGEGLDALLGALDAALDRTKPSPADELPYLPIDRVFTVSGFGTVVTGTLHGGALSVGDDVEVLPQERRARVRGIQSHRRAVGTVGPGTRVALNLAPLGHTQVARGDVVAAPGTIRASRRVGARVRVLPHLEAGLAHGLQVTVHVGSAEVGGTVGIIGAETVPPGETGWIQIKFDRATPVVRGQRFVLRLPAPLGTVAGGEVVDAQARGRRHDPALPSRMAALAADNHRVALHAVLSDSRPHSAQSVAAALSLSLASTRALLAEEARSGEVVDLGGLYVAAASWHEIEERALAVVRSFHETNPLLPGMPREELRRRIGIATQAGAAAVARLVGSGVLVATGPLAALPGWSGGAGSRPDEVARVLRVLGEEPFSPPSGVELLSRAQTDRAVLEAIARDGRIVRVTEGLYFERGVYDRMVAEIVQTIEREGEITVAGVRDRYQTSRKYALALLEHLDDERITRRVGDGRVLGSRRPACA